MDLRTPGRLGHPFVVKVAVVGGGISGLGAARALDGDHEVVVYERRSNPGGHARTVDLPSVDGGLAVDTGFIVYNRSNYPRFTNLLRELNVTTRSSTMSFSYRDAASGYEYAGHGLLALLGGGRNLLWGRTYPMIRDLLRFYRSAPRDRDRRSHRTTLGEYLEENGYSSSFIDHHLVPMVSAIWSVSPDRSREMPFRYVVDFFENHGLLNLWNRPAWRSICGGSRQYVRALVDRLDAELRTGVPARGVHRETGGVRVRDDSGVERFDAAILACHSDTALSLLEDPRDAERSVLGAIRYASNQLTLHRDPSVLPKNRSLWAAWNYHSEGGERTRPTVTYNLSLLQGLAVSPPLLMTLNTGEQLDRSKILDRFEYDHPYIDVAALEAQRRYGEINGNGNVYYAGAYWFSGFHEDGLRSGLRAARTLRRNVS